MGSALGEEGGGGGVWGTAGESVKMATLVRRAVVMSASSPIFVPSRIKRCMGDEPGETIATTRLSAM